MVDLGLALKDGTSMQVSLFVIPVICEPLVGQPISSSVDADHHLAALDLADFSTGDLPMNVDVLIGCDYYWQLVTVDIYRGSSELAAIHTKLGWVLSGPTMSLNTTRCTTNLVMTHVLRADLQECDTGPLDEELRSFWDLETLGIRETERTFYEEFTSSSIEFHEGRYKVSLPWKEIHEPLSDNYQLSLRRLRGLLRRLKEDPAILKEYDATIQDQLCRGIVEMVEKPSEGIPGIFRTMQSYAVISPLPRCA